MKIHSKKFYNVDNWVEIVFGTVSYPVNAGDVKKVYLLKNHWKLDQVPS